MGLMESMRRLVGHGCGWVKGKVRLRGLLGQAIKRELERNVLLHYDVSGLEK